MPHGPFRWATQVTARAEAWYDSGAVALFAGTHDGFGDSESLGYVRVVAFIRPDVWIVRDEVHGRGEHDLRVHWQCAPGIRPVNEPGGMRLQLDGRMVDVRVAEPGGQWSIEKGIVSPTYGAVHDATHLRYGYRGPAPFAVTTIIAEGTATTGTTIGSHPLGRRQSLMGRPDRLSGDGRLGST